MLYGFGIAGYKSFGPEPQFVAPLAKINIFAGQNNVGKSNLLKSVRLACIAAQLKNDEAKLSKEEQHQGKRPASFEVFLPVALKTDLIETYILKILNNDARTASRLKDTILKILISTPRNQAGAAWFSYTFQGNRIARASPISDDFPRLRDKFGGVNANEWEILWSELTQMRGGNALGSWIPETLDRLSPAGKGPDLPVYYVEAHRKIGEPGSPFSGLNGAGLIARLLALQNPKVLNRAEYRKKFDSINSFIANVTGEPDACLQVDSAAEELSVNIRGADRKIQDLGTGIHELIILAAAATAYDGVILCIEEPEIHLHPRLQKRLLSYLSSETNNQYFITTHSAHLLDCPGASLFHLRLNSDGETIVQSLDAIRRAPICFDLGYRASDLVQANCIIWVEGPSDRIYVNAWLQHAEPKLQEGLHYSIMFYGGRLLSHLSLSDEVSDFIELQRLNRHVVIIMDSDREKEDGPLLESKSRLIGETQKHGGLAWVTAGREIENYIGTDEMSKAFSKVHPKTDFNPPRTQWEIAYSFKGSESSFKVDKLRLAREATEVVDLDVLDLKERVNELVLYILRCNEELRE